MTSDDTINYQMNRAMVNQSTYSSTVNILLSNDNQVIKSFSIISQKQVKSSNNHYSNNFKITEFVLKQQSNNNTYNINTNSNNKKVSFQEEDDDDVNAESNYLGRFIEFTNDTFKQLLLDKEDIVKKKFVELLSFSYHPNVAQLYELYYMIKKEEEENENIIGLFYLTEYLPDENKLIEIIKSTPTTPRITTTNENNQISTINNNNIPKLTLDHYIYFFTQLVDIFVMFHTKHYIYSNNHFVRYMNNSLYLKVEEHFLQKRCFIYLTLGLEDVLNLIIEEENIKQSFEPENEVNSIIITSKLKEEELIEQERLNVSNLGLLFYQWIIKDEKREEHLSSSYHLLDETTTRTKLEEQCTDRNVIDILLDLLYSKNNNSTSSFFNNSLNINQLHFNPYLMKFKKTFLYQQEKQLQNEFFILKKKVEFFEKMKTGISHLISPFIMNNINSNSNSSNNLNEEDKELSRLDSNESIGDITQNGTKVIKDINGFDQLVNNGGDRSSLSRSTSYTSPRRQSAMANHRHSLRLHYTHINSEDELRNYMSDQETSNEQVIVEKKTSNSGGNNDKDLLKGIFKNKKTSDLISASSKPTNKEIDDLFNVLYKQQKEAFKFNAETRHNYFSTINNSRTLTLVQNKLIGSDYFTARCEQKITTLNNYIKIRIDKINSDNDLVIGIITKEHDDKLNKKGGALGTKRLQHSFGINFLNGQCGIDDHWKKFCQGKLLKDKYILQVTYLYEKKCLNLKYQTDEKSEVVSLGDCFEGEIDSKSEWFFAVSLYREKSSVTILE
ncbi:hypothetical protein ABK040_015130 [Willaertia magna]